ncbi:MAG: MotA/TolQ/ExbB proton channel family protein [Leptospiraceae bacterium]|nr:MotA/TolQ/ExbB proton channel family protein [Leptospiraceae bacterium]
MGQNLKDAGIIAYPLLILSIFSLAIILYLGYSFYQNKITKPLLSNFERKIGWLSHISSISTLLGLLGTVLGIQSSFTNMKESGQASIEIFAGGISQALSTTIIGLSIAIPSLFFYHFYMDKIEKLEENLSNLSLKD